MYRYVQKDLVLLGSGSRLLVAAERPRGEAHATFERTNMEASPQPCTRLAALSVRMLHAKGTEGFPQLVFHSPVLVRPRVLSAGACEPKGRNP